MLDDDGNWQTVTSVRVEQKPLNSYNLEVNTDHTFFIRGLGGLDGIWVHNKDCWTSIPDDAQTSRVGNQTVYTFENRGRNVQVINNPDWTPNGTEKKYVEVSVDNGRVNINNLDQPNIYRSENTQARDDRGFTSDPLHPSYSTGFNRPYMRADTIAAIEARYERQSNGDFYDPVRGITVQGPIDIGHVAGWEHRRLELAAEEVGLTQPQFNEYVNRHPEHFQLENMSINRSHVDEKPGIDEIEDIVSEMKDDLQQGKLDHD